MRRPHWAWIVWSDGTRDRIRAKSAGDIIWMRSEEFVTVERIAALGHWDLPDIRRELGL